MTRSFLRGLAFVAVAGLTVAACKATNKTGSGFGGSGGDNSTVGGPTGQGGSTGATLDVSVGTGGSTGSGCDTTCSADLHDVLDCNGNVLMTCPADKGCGSGGCVDPCQAAKENGSTIGCDFYAVTPRARSSRRKAPASRRSSRTRGRAP